MRNKENRCSLCGLDINKPMADHPPPFIGCYCTKENNPYAPVGRRGKSSLSKSGHTLDYIDDYYDGYGYYDAIRRNIEQEEFYAK